MRFRVRVGIYRIYWKRAVSFMSSRIHKDPGALPLVSTKEADSQACKSWCSKNSLVTKTLQSSLMVSDYNCPSLQGGPNSKVSLLCFDGLCRSRLRLGVYLSSEPRWPSPFSLSPFLPPSFSCLITWKKLLNKSFISSWVVNTWPLENLNQQSAKTNLELGAISLQTSAPNSAMHPSKMCRGGQSFSSWLTNSVAPHG